MKRIIFYLLMLFPVIIFATEDQTKCSHWLSFFKPMCLRFHQILDEGHTDLYISGYAWHNRYTYRPEKIKSFNEAAWGGGLGKGLFDEKGNWHGLYAIAFLDSHRHVEPVVGYAYLKVANFSEHLKAGIGYSVLVTSRVDIYNSIPFPGILPWASIFYKQTSIAATYIPGAAGAGNVLYILAKYTF
jgi:palmitoyl transferase